MGLDVQLASVGTWRGLEKTVRPSPEHVQQVAPEFGVSLAQHFGGICISEYARDYLENLRSPYVLEDVNVRRVHKVILLIQSGRWAIFTGFE